MIPYVFLFSSFIFLFFVMEYASGSKTPRLSKIYILLLPLYIFTILYAGQIGTDSENYKRLYYLANEFPLEPGFSYLMIVGNAFKLEPIIFFKCLAFLQLLLLSLIVIRLKDPLFFILFYFAAFYLNFHFNALRNSLSLLLIGAVYVRYSKTGWLTMISSAMLHYSSVITVLLQKIATYRRNLILYLTIFLVLSTFTFFWMAPAVFSDYLGNYFLYKAYLVRSYSGRLIYPALLLKLAIILLMQVNGSNRRLSVIFAVIVFAVHVYSPILSRVSDIVLFLAVLDFCLRNRLNRYRSVTILISLILVASSYLIPFNDCRLNGKELWCLSM